MTIHDEPQYGGLIDIWQFIKLLGMFFLGYIAGRLS